MKKYVFGLLTTLLAITLMVSGHSVADLDTFQHIECVLEPILHPRTSNSYDQSSENGKLTHVKIEESVSTNWSGYAAATSLTNPTKDSVSSVSASWTVPKLSAASDDTYCSIWVGIDGYSDGTVEQIGTEHNWSNGAQENYAWFEMYPNGMYQIQNFPVDINDNIEAEVSYVGQNTFKLSITNHTKNIYSVVPSTYTKSTTALRSSAEWIVEAPSTNSGVLPLSHFGTVSLTNCQATIDNVTGPINDIKWVSDQITMQTPNGVTKALPTGLSSNGESFSVTWENE